MSEGIDEALVLLAIYTYFRRNITFPTYHHYAFHHKPSFLDFERWAISMTTPSRHIQTPIEPPQVLTIRLIQPWSRARWDWLFCHQKDDPCKKTGIFKLFTNSSFSVLQWFISVVYALLEPGPRP